MALANIQDLLATFPGTATLELAYFDEMAVQANGQTRVQDIAPELWRLSAMSFPLRPSQYREWKARLSSLENGKLLFWGYDCSAKYPILYPNGSWPTGVAFSGQTAQINSVGANNKSLSLKLVPNGYIVHAGDMISFSYGTGPIQALHQAVETVAGAVAGVTPVFEVRPHIFAGATPNLVVRVKQPRVTMILQAGSLQAATDGLLGGVISFQGSQVFDPVV